MLRCRIRYVSFDSIPLMYSYGYYNSCNSNPFDGVVGMEVTNSGLTEVDQASHDH